MTKMKEPSKNLIAILSIFAAFVWVLVVVILWLSIRSLNFPNDLGIWIGSLGSIAAFSAVIITTQMQIKAQRENLQEQIDNQNRQKYRPYLDISSRIIDTSEVYQKNRMNFRYKLSSKNYNEDPTTPGYEMDIGLFINNVGAGIAQNIELYDCVGLRFMYEDDWSSDESNTDLDIDRNMLEPKKILASKMIELDIALQYKELQDKYRDVAYILVLYSDIYGNMYTTMFEFEITHGRILPKIKYAEYYEEHYKYKILLATCKVDIRKVVNEYRILRNRDKGRK